MRNHIVLMFFYAVATGAFFALLWRTEVRETDPILHRRLHLTLLRRNPRSPGRCIPFPLNEGCRVPSCQVAGWTCPPGQCARRERADGVPLTRPFDSLRSLRATLFRRERGLGAGCRTASSHREPSPSREGARRADEGVPSTAFRFSGNRATRHPPTGLVEAVKIAIVAGEASGDLHGAEVLREFEESRSEHRRIRHWRRSSRWHRECGCCITRGRWGSSDSSTSCSTTGSSSVSSKTWPRLSRASGRTRCSLWTTRASIWRMARRCKELGLRVVYYISPRSGRGGADVYVISQSTSIE